MIYLFLKDIIVIWEDFLVNYNVRYIFLYLCLRLVMYVIF